MKYGDTDQPTDVPVTTAGGIGQNPREGPEGVSRLSARTVSCCPQTKNTM
jgi:hypothetical protein